MNPHGLYELLVDLEQERRRERQAHKAADLGTQVRLAVRRSDDPFCAAAELLSQLLPVTRVWLLGPSQDGTRPVERSWPPGEAPRLPELRRLKRPRHFFDLQQRDPSLGPELRAAIFVPLEDGRVLVCASDAPGRLEAQHVARVQSAAQALSETRPAQEQTASDVDLAEARLRGVVHSLSSAILVLDADLRVSLVNRPFLRLFGIEDTPESLRGADVVPGTREAARLFEAPKDFLRGIQACLAGNQARLDTLRMVDGRILEREFSPIWVGTERAGSLWEYRDITAQASYAERLRQTVAETEELARSRSDFLSRLSHEVRTPLNAMLGLIELSLEGAVGREERELLRTARDNGTALATLLNEVLTLSRIEAGAGASPEAFDPRTLLEEGVRAVVGLGARDLDLSGVCAAGVPDLLRADRHRIASILANLLTNAVQATPAGGRVTARMDWVDGLLRLEVEDTGVGIAPEDQARIWERFVRLRPGGTGMGLYVVRTLVGVLDGELGFHSEPDVGSRFWVALPAKPLRRSEPGQRALRKSAASLRVAVGAESADLRTALVDLGVQVVPLEQAQVLVVDGDRRLAGWSGPTLAVARPGQRVPGQVVRRPWTRASLLTGLLEAAGSPLPPTLMASESQASPGHRILVVEDHAQSRWVVQRHLESAGHRVFTASNAQSALVAFHRHRGELDLVLLDLELPDRSGLEVLRELRALDAQLPVCVVSAAQGRREEVMAAGAEEFVPKPLGREALLAVVRRRAALPVLLVEDCEDSRVMLRRRLERMCAGPVHGAGSLAEAREWLSRRRFRLVLSDLTLPDGDGRALAAERPPGTALVALTGYSGEELDEELRALGFTELATKPLNTDGIREGLSRWVRPRVAVEVDPDILDLIPAFLTRRRRELRLMREALAGADWTALARLGHRARGGAANYGFAALAEDFRQLEEAAAVQDEAAAAEHLESARRALFEVSWRPAQQNTSVPERDTSAA